MTKQRSLLLLSNTHWAFLSQAMQGAGNFALTLLILSLASFNGLGLFTAYFMWVLVSKEFIIHVVLTPMSISIGGSRTSLAWNYIYFIFIKSIFIVLLLLLLCLGSANLLNYELDTSLVFLSTLCAITSALSEIFRRICVISDIGDGVVNAEIMRWTTSIAGLYFFARESSIQIVTVALICISLGNLLASAYLSRSCQHALAFDASNFKFRSVWSQHLAFIKWSSAFVLVKAIIARLPMIIGGSLLGVGALGVYRAWFQVANILNLPFHALTQVNGANTAKILKEQGRTEALSYLRNSTKLTGFAALVMGLMLLSVTDFIAEILEVDGFVVNHAALFGSLLMCNLFILARLPLQTMAEITHRTKELFFVQLTSGFLGLPVTFYVIKFFGVVGMGFALAASTFFSLVILYFIFPWRESSLGNIDS